MNERIARTPKEMVDVAELCRQSWALFQSKPIEHVVASLLVVVLSALSLGALLGPLSVGQIRMIEKQQRGEDPRIEDVFAGFSSFGAAFLTTLTVFVAVILGSLLLVLPGIFVGAAWAFALWFVALEGATVSEALGGSWQLLKHQTPSVLVVLVLMVVVNLIAGSVVIATLLTTPLTMIFATLAFQDMIGNAAADAEPLG